MERVFCIAAGQIVTKKSNHIIHRKNQYLNYGLLSLATVLNQEGIGAIQIQGNFDSPQATLNTACEKGVLHSPFPVLISIPSFYAISWVNEFISLLKEASPSIKVIIGGRWVIDGQLEHMRGLVPLADEIIHGTAEHLIRGIVEQDKKTKSLSFVSSSNSLDYSLLHQRELYQPSIEISRGCGMGCSFCQEKSEPLSSLKHPNEILEEASSSQLIDDLQPMNFYLEASMFVPNRNWVEIFTSSIKTIPVQNFHWRTEARVDSLYPRFLEPLYRCGLRVIDLGLESADHTQLIRMSKTKDPIRYLRKASALIEEAHRLGIKVKINILLFAGETLRSIDKTREWLEQHSRYITGLSVGPVLVFGWKHRVSEYISQLEGLGARPCKQEVLGVTHLNLSDEIAYETSIALSTEIGQSFTTAENYFALKSFSYFSREYMYEDFLMDCRNVSEPLSFSINQEPFCSDILTLDITQPSGEK